MADRIAPKGGYLFEEKDKYRREVWSVFAKQTWAPSAKVGFMPSTEGAEIPIALDLGFKEENLYAIDKNAALLATAPWRKLYPGVKVYGTDVLRSGARLRQDGVQLDCMNMDLCSNLSQPMLDTFTGFINSGCHDGRIVVALTVLCGRESTAVDTLAKIIYRNRPFYKEQTILNHRINIACIECERNGFEYVEHMAGEYMSGKQKMCFGVVTFEKINLKKERKEYALRFLCDVAIRRKSMIASIRRGNVDSGRAYEDTKRDVLSAVMEYKYCSECQKIEALDTLHNYPLNSLVGMVERIGQRGLKDYAI